VKVSFLLNDPLIVSRVTLFILSHSMCHYKWGLDWCMDLLTTYTHDLELQALRAPLLISTVHKSSWHPLSLVQPAVSSPAVPWHQLLTMEILQLHMLRSSLHSLQCRTLWNSLSSKSAGYNDGRTAEETQFSCCCVWPPHYQESAA
jgi:hypothetical protein